MHHDTELQRLVATSSRMAKVKAWLKRWRWFALFVIAPSILATIYYGLIASDIYVSESRFVIKAPDQRQRSMSSLSSFIESTGLGGGKEQTSEIIDYLRSRDALHDLSRNINVRAAFGAAEADRLSRFPLPFHNASFESLYKYYGSMVSTQRDAETGLTILTAKAFRAEDARAINVGLLNLSEDLVNHLNARINSKGIEEAEGRVRVAQNRVRNARIQLSAYRNRSELLDPQQQGIGVLNVSDGLIAQEAALRAKLTEVERVTPNHPSIPAMRERIAALSAQVAAQTGRAVGTPGGIASKMSTYENLLAEQEFATQMLTAANATLEQARAEAIKQQYYLERVVEPSRPDDALLPARLKSILTVVFTCLCLYLVGWMLIVGILEHAPEE